MNPGNIFTLHFGLVVLSTIPLLIFLFFVFRFSKCRELFQKLEQSTELSFDCSPAMALFLSSLVGLLAELLVIRLHGSYFQVFGFYKNVSLLSCFLGLGIGLTIPHFMKRWVLLTGIGFACQFTVLHILAHTDLQVMILNPSSDYMSMGLSSAHDLSSKFLSNLFIISVFLFNALCFIPLGNLVSQAATKFNSFHGYGLNLIGSAAGILGFTILSMLYTGPKIWVIVFFLLLLPLFYRSLIWVSGLCVPLLVTLLVFSIDYRPLQSRHYSPYQKISLVAHRTGRNFLYVNNFYYQRLIDLQSLSEKDMETSHYGIPFSFKNAKGDVLVLGSGTGNDVASALMHGARHVDAVEIDPLILYFGEMLHPMKPYSDPRVNIIVDDARAYFRRSDKKYDLIVYGLLDSHTALSGKGAIRLDSYVYTVDAFRQAKNSLKEDGVLCLSFAITEGTEYITLKMKEMLKAAYDGKEPYVIHTGYDKGVTFCSSANPGFRDEISSRYELFIPDEKKLPEIDLATDDWPFLFIASKQFPSTYLLTFVLVLLASLALMKAIIPKSVAKSTYPLRAFFLGTGFMLIETKAITELALVYGSTWYVVSIAILFVLLMAYLANLVAQRHQDLPDWIMFLCLFIALGFGIYFTGSLQRQFSIESLKLLSPLVLTLPLFFSGYCFSQELKKYEQLGPVLSANLLGGLIGGILEYNALQFGYMSLYFLALAIYFLAFLSPLLQKKTT